MGAFSLNRVFVVAFVSLGLFSVLFGYMPNDFFSLQADYAAPTSFEREVVDFYSTHNLTLYSNTWSFNITYGGDFEYLENVPTTDHWLEVHWHSAYFGTGYYPIIEFRHSYPSWFFGLWRDYHNLYLTQPYREKAGNPLNLPWYAIDKQRFLNLADSENYSFFEVSCEHLTVNFVFTPRNSSQTLEEAWDSGELHGLMSYEIDWDAMKPSAWSLIGQLLLFQAPDLGISGIGGSILSYMIGAVLWICIAITIYTIVSKLFPTVSGGID